MLTFIEQTIAPAMREGLPPRTIRAQVCGPLAYHRMLATNSDGLSSSWTITHIPSGMAIAEFIRDEETAQRMIAVALESGVDWSRGLDYFERNRKSKRLAKCREALRAVQFGEIGL